MKKFTSIARNSTDKADHRGISQLIFIAAGIGIIVGGLWSLYMGNAPYHPEDAVSRNDVFLASD